MCSGVVKVITLPLTDAMRLTSLMGRPERLNQVSELGNGSSMIESVGLCRMNTARSDAQIVTLVGAPLRVGRPVHAAALYSLASTSTNWPMAKPAELATATDVAPLAPLATRLCDVASFGFGQRLGPTTTIG
jgi:hypothetical protein